jgi:hypothetical protein
MVVLQTVADWYWDPPLGEPQPLLAMTDYRIAKYFRQPDYLAIDGKPVVIVFTPRELRRDMGTDAVRTAFARMG